MKSSLLLMGAIAVVTLSTSAHAQTLHANIPYTDSGEERHVLDIYTPEGQTDPGRPVFFWIHGGGWVMGDKSNVGHKPRVLTEKGCVLVSTQYRLLPTVSMEILMEDIARSLAWVHRHIAEHGGNPKHIIVGGHSAGAQLAALLCTDHRWLERQGVPFNILKGCIPVDGDTYDIPKIIATAEHRQMLYGGKMFTFGHRQKFGNDPEKHVDFSAVTHVSAGKGIPPFLLLYFTENPDTGAQAHRLEKVLRQAGVQARAFGKRETNHRQLNNDLGLPDDPATQAMWEFLEPLL
jgi:acetyl esterase/lipase